MCVCEIRALLMMQIQAPLMCQIYEAQFDTARVELTPGRPTTSRHVSDQREYVSWVIARVIAPTPINEFAPKESLIAIRLIKCLMTVTAANAPSYSTHARRSLMDLPPRAGPEYWAFATKCPAASSVVDLDAQSCRDRPLRPRCW